MEFTSYQPPEIYGNDGQLIRQGAFGPNTPFYDPNGRGMYAAAASASAAQTAAGQAAAITTPDGLAARVLALENSGFSFVDGVLCQEYDD